MTSSLPTSKAVCTEKSARFYVIGDYSTLDATLLISSKVDFDSECKSRRIPLCIEFGDVLFYIFLLCVSPLYNCVVPLPLFCFRYPTLGLVYILGKVLIAPCYALMICHFAIVQPSDMH